MIKTEILEAEVSFQPRAFAKPLQLSSGTITEITEATVRVRVKVGGQEAEGRGSIYLSDLWAWPGTALTHDEKDAALRGFCEEIASELKDRCGSPHHPLELGLRLHHSLSAEAAPPLSARAVCTSPFDAALHDAAGRALGVSAFALYEDDADILSADALFPEGGVVRSIRRLLSRPPATRLAGWWLASAKDDLSRDFAPAAAAGGYRCFKIKLLGKDSAADAARTVEVFRVLREAGLADPLLSIDSNEGNPDAASVGDYLDRLEAEDAEAYTALQYIEQPTGRDISQFANDWRTVSARKPVMLDEGLTGLDAFALAERQGWSGFAIKTCKGHSFGLAAAAWAHERGMLLAMQDLTNPGLAAIHSYLFAAHIPSINGVELNSAQYTPEANAAWRPRLDGLFAIKDGFHSLENSSPVGLGSDL